MTLHLVASCSYLGILARQTLGSGNEENENLHALIEITEEQEQEAEITMALFTAAVVGGSGGVGQCLVASLLADNRVGKVILLNRRLQNFADEPRVVQVVLPEFNVDAAKNTAVHFENVDALFMTLGVGAPSKLGRDNEGNRK